jgi:hypothetical protein
MSHTIKILKFLLIILFSCICTVPGIGQVSNKLRSTLSAGGSSGFITVNGRQYYLQQSTGQQSITGISQKQGYLLRQGFIQPVNGQYNKTVQETLPAIIFPNPFSSHMSVTLPVAPDGHLYVTIYDLTGKIAFFRKYVAAGKLDLDLSSLPSSVYIIRINTTTKYFYSRIIKL